MHHQLNESETRYNVINPLLAKASWNLVDRRSVHFEVPVYDYDASPINGITDYCLFRSNGEVFAVIEAKRIKRDARVGKEQLYQYLTKSEARQTFAFVSFNQGEVSKKQTPLKILAHLVNPLYIAPFPCTTVHALFYRCFVYLKNALYPAFRVLRHFAYSILFYR